MNDVAHHRWDEGKAVPIECFRSVALATEFHFKPSRRHRSSLLDPASLLLRAAGAGLASAGVLLTVPGAALGSGSGVTCSTAMRTCAAGS